MKTPKKNKALKKIIEFYLHSNAFKRLSGKSQYEYERLLKSVAGTKIKNKVLGNIQVEDITAGILNQAYEQWLEAHGIRQANYHKQVLSVAWRYAMSMDIMINNPVSLIRTQTSKPRRVRWTREQVYTFLETAYNVWEWRSTGLMVHMAYEWGQRVGDMRTLTWSDLDLEECTLHLTQSKRNAEVHLPISESLCVMLNKQKEEFGFQEYVAPKINIKRGLIRAYQKEEISNAINAVLDKANLPRELTAMDLRRTAITEAVVAGVDQFGIMQFSGHQNPSSVKPYLVNTYEGASRALSARWGKKDE